MERTYEAPSNEAPHMILGYHQGRLGRTYGTISISINRQTGMSILRLISAWFPQSESSMLCYELVLHGSWKGEGTATDRIGQQFVA